MSGGVKIFGGGNSFEPGVVTTFPANTIPYINGSQETAYDSIFTYQSSQLGVGISTSLGARLHVKGANDSSGSALKIQTATYEVLNVYNNRQVVIGGGSVVSGTDYLINGFGAIGGTTTTLTVNGSNSDNVIRFMNTGSATRGGLEVVRNSLSSGRIAFAVYGGSTQVFHITSDGTLNLSSNYQSYADYNGNFIQCVTSGSHGSGIQGVLYNSVGTSSSQTSHIFSKGRSTAVANAGAIVHLYSNFVDSGNTSSGTTPFLKIAPIVNLTGTGTKNVIGIHYVPTMTSLTGGGSHAALLVESGNSGFGISTMPTAVVSIAPSTTSRASLNIPAGTAPSSPNSGDLWFDSSDSTVKFYDGSTIRTLSWV